MLTLPRLVLALVVACLASMPSPSSAEQAQDFGDYVVHYSAITTDTLLPEVARAYGITRSSNRALLTLTVLKKVMGTTGVPVAATVKGTATNLNGQLRTLEPRTVQEGNAVYHLAEFPISNEEVLDFVLQVTPNGVDRSLTVRFRQQFFTRGDVTKFDSKS
jgi:Domain of unknown function (DUF4426)